MVEILVILVVMTCIVYVFWPRPLAQAKAHAPRIQCVNNLKQIGLAARVWSGDSEDLCPPLKYQTNGGTRDFITGPNAFRHFQIMSNELSSPKFLICPAESDKNRHATNFADLNNSNISFFVGVDACETNPLMILSGDHNITNGTPIKNGLLRLTTNVLAGWTSEIHKRVGNILLADGSVQQDSILGLQNQIASTGVATNWVQMPVLGP
jgi:prepilin-type processing-associated H-X9-DG protein